MPLQDAVVRREEGLAELELLVHQRKAADQRERRIALTENFVPELGAVHANFRHVFYPAPRPKAAASY